MIPEELKTQQLKQTIPHWKKKKPLVSRKGRKSRKRKGTKRKRTEQKDEQKKKKKKRIQTSKGKSARKKGRKGKIRPKKKKMKMKPKKKKKSKDKSKQLKRHRQVPDKLEGEGEQSLLEKIIDQIMPGEKLNNTQDHGANATHHTEESFNIGKVQDVLGTVLEAEDKAREADVDDDPAENRENLGNEVEQVKNEEVKV